jgi:predicted TIM-barrel fold metal-dependent hydrolase
LGGIDYWCNLFTPEVLDREWFGQPEIAAVIEWWGMAPRIKGQSVDAFVAGLDAAGMDAVLVPSSKMMSYQTKQLIWNVSEQEVHDVAAAAPGRIFGLVGIDPREGMKGVARLESWMSRDSFVGAHLHTYGYGLPLNHRRYYPFYAKCAELGVPVVMQAGHSAERMPSALGQPILIDDIALDFPELTIVAAHTGWPWIEEMIALAWKHANVYIGTSAHRPKYLDPALVRFANSRGRGKVLFGTDWPVVDHADALAEIDGLDLRDEARALFRGDAARKVFRLT